MTMFPKVILSAQNRTDIPLRQPISEPEQKKPKKQTLTGLCRLDAVQGGGVRE